MSRRLATAQMSRRLAAALFLLTLLIAGCGPDTVGPNERGPSDGKPTSGQPLPTHADALAAEIEQALSVLMGELLPNDNSTLGKFNYIKQLWEAGDRDSAIVMTGNLVNFIEQTYTKFISPPKNGDPNKPLTLGTTTYTVTELKDKIIRDLWAFVGLTGNICAIPGANPTGTFCRSPDNSTGFVYFPPEIFSRLTYVSVNEIKGGLMQLLLDEHSDLLQVVSGPISDFSGFNLKPLVVVCVKQTDVSDSESALLARLLLGHKHGGGFKLLPAPNYNAYPAEALAEAESFCASPPPAASALFDARTPLGRLGNRLANLLLPSALVAQGEITSRSIGGSAEEFSEFGAVDPGMRSIGGSAEEFAPPAYAPGAFVNPFATTHILTTISGTAGQVVTDGTGLPAVTVETPGGIKAPNVKVTFALNDPTTAPYDASPSQASLCDVPDPPGHWVTDTDVDGQAKLLCLNFGTRAGFRNLKATFDPTGVDPLACMLVADGEGGYICDTPNADVNWLVETTPGPAATIEKVLPEPTAGAAYAVVSPAPVVRVKDQYANLKPGATVSWDPGGSSGSVSPASSTTGAYGETTTAWTLGPGSNTLLASIPNGQSVLFSASGSFDLALANACVTGGQKDNVTLFGITVPSEAKPIALIGLNLSSTGAPGQTENFLVTMTATRTKVDGTGVDTWIATARLQSGSNSSKGTESEVQFDFLGTGSKTPIPTWTGTGNNKDPGIRITMTAQQVVDGLPGPMPSNRAVNMNAGGCPAGSKNCKPTKVAAAAQCEVTEWQRSPLVDPYRKGLAARVYTIK